MDVDIRDVYTACTERTQQSERNSSVSHVPAKLVEVSTYRGYLMGAGERKTHCPLQSPGNVDFVYAAKCIDSPLDAIQLYSISVMSLVRISLGLNLFNIRVFATPLIAQPFLYLASYPFLEKCTSAAPIHRHERDGADNGKPLIHSRLWQSRLTFAGSKE